MNRCMLLFESAIKSPYTKTNYTQHLTYFCNYAKCTPESLLTKSDLQTTLEDYVLHLRQTINPNAVAGRMRGIRHFLIMNRISSVNWDIIRKMYPAGIKPQTLRAYTDAELTEMLHNATTPRNTAIIHFMASTGCRVGVFDHGLKISHVTPMGNITAVKLYAGHIEEYWAFLTPQATASLYAYLDTRQTTPDSPLFATSKEKPLQWNSVRSMMQRAAPHRTKENGRYTVQINHGLRKRYNTILKSDNNINYNIAEKLMGHKNGLDGVYFTPTIQQLYAEFEKVITDLEVSHNG